MKTGLEQIIQERFEQMDKHDYSVQNDYANNNHYQLSEAASLLCHVDEEDVQGEANEDKTFDYSGCCPVEWNEIIWNKMMNKPYKERLIIAGALIAAEIDRLQMIEIRKEDPTLDPDLDY